MYGEVKISITYQKRRSNTREKNNNAAPIYVNEKNTNEFQGYNDTKIIASSDLLDNTLKALGAEQRVKLPAPGNDIEVWYGMEYYKEEPSHGTAYIADITPMEYVEILKDNGYTIIRSYEDPYYAFYG